MSVEVTRLRLDDGADAARWQEYVDARPDSLYSDLAGWRRLFRELYGFQDYSFASVERGAVTGVLSLYHVPSRLMGNMLVTNPFFGSGGFYWDSEVARHALAEQALEVARSIRVDYVELRMRAAVPAPFEANTDFAEFDLALDPDPEQTWTGRLASNVRQNIRKSRKQSLEFRLSEEHGPCFELLRRTLRAHGTPFHGERFFRLLRKHLGDHVCFSEVWHSGRIVAGGIVVRHKGTISTPYIGSLEQSRALRSNYFQYWKLIEEYTPRGVDRFEMGRSPRGSTHARFKTKWGCEEIPAFYNYHVVNPLKGYRSVSRPSAVQRLATRVWRRLPLAVTTTLGPHLFRHVP